MSDISRHGLPQSAVLVDIYDRSEDPFGKLSIVHPSHPMRKAKTIEVSSLKEMVRPSLVGVPIYDLIDDTTALDYAIWDAVMPKPELNVYFGADYTFVYRIASTIQVPEDSKLVNGVTEAIKGLLLRRLDAIEAIIWFTEFLYRAVWPPFLADPASYREIFALSRALLSRMAPSDAFDVMLSPKDYGAALLENSAGSGNNANYAEPQIASGRLTLVPIAFNGFIYSFPSFLCVYPSNLPSLCRRYIYEIFSDTKARDNDSDTNVYRMTAERYLLIAIPADYYSTWQEQHVAPIVGVITDGALNNIRDTFGVGALINLDTASSVR